MSHARQHALERLRAVDRELASVDRLTLAPERAQARSLESIGEHLLGETSSMSSELTSTLAEGLCETAVAIRTHFPDNLFWDLDHLAASVLREAQRQVHPAAHARASFATIVEIHALFGRSTALRFRYVHDFMYGFDWAKWVARAPSTRRMVGPFDLAFLRAMRTRAGELLSLIETGRDEKYPPLQDRRHRNPFGFSREPEAELALHRDLAARRLIPVRAWTFDEPPEWNRAFAGARVARARALGFDASTP